MDRKEVAKQYVSYDIKLTPIMNLLPRNFLGKRKQLKYLDKMCDIVGWKHAYNIDVNGSLYKGWKELGELLGRKQDHTAILTWGYRSALWVEEIDNKKYIIINNLRGTSFECEVSMNGETVYKLIDHLEDLLLP